MTTMNAVGKTVTPTRIRVIEIRRTMSIPGEYNIIRVTFREGTSGF